MIVKTFSLNERFLKTCNGFCNAKHKLGSEGGQSTQDIKCLFCRSFILRLMLFCACLFSSVNYALGKHHVIMLINILYLCQAGTQEITL